MDGRELINELVPQVTRNATVVAVEEKDDEYDVTIAGTTGVVATCQLPRDEVDEATRRDTARARIAQMLKRCADHTVMQLPDVRG